LQALIKVLILIALEFLFGNEFLLTCSIHFSGVACEIISEEQERSLEIERF